MAVKSFTAAWAVAKPGRPAWQAAQASVAGSFRRAGSPWHSAQATACEVPTPMGKKAAWFTAPVVPSLWQGRQAWLSKR